MYQIKRFYPQNFVFSKSNDVLESGIGKHYPILLEYQYARQGALGDGLKEPVLLLRLKDDGVCDFYAVWVMHLFSINHE
jgi:hypothetical protein